LIPSVRSALGAVQSTLPAFSLMIGTCEDGLPFLVDLQDATAGSVLVTGEARSGKTRLLKAMVDSVVHLNSPREVQYTVISSYPEEWENLIQPHRMSGHCRGLYYAGDPNAHQLILEMASLAERRREGDVPGPVIVLVVDDFTPLLDADYDVQVNLHWLFHQGPQGRIWPIVALNSNRALNLHYWIDLFRTRLIGRISSSAAAQRLAIRPGVRAARLQDGIEFTAWLDNRWINFWVADPGMG